SRPAIANIPRRRRSPQRFRNLRYRRLSWGSISDSLSRRFLLRSRNTPRQSFRSARAPRLRAELIFSRCSNRGVYSRPRPLFTATAPEARCIHPISIRKLLMKKLLAITVAMLSGAGMAMAQDAAASPSPSPSPAASPASRTATAESVVVTSEELDVSREQIVPSLGATRYTVGPDRLNQQAQGEDAPFNQTILRFPGVAQDSFGQLHLRGEHANLQYRINDVLLPEGITGF